MKLIITLIIIFCQISQALTITGNVNNVSSNDLTKATVQSADTNTINKLSSLGTSLLSYLPSDLSKALKTYLDVMQPAVYDSDISVGGQNSGLNKTFTDIQKNNCTAFLIKDFFSDNTIKEENNINNISIIENGQIAKSKKLQDGWVWNKALALTEGNPNLAMTIIGACGHDDVAQSNILCPKPTSNFFLAKGLGARVDINDDIRKYVIDTQSIDADPKNIKAKNYHFYGSAYLGCRMLENGVSPEKIPNYAMIFAYMYRRIRICRNAIETSSKFLPIYEKYQTAYTQHVRSLSNKVAPKFEDFMEQSLKNNLIDGFSIKYSYLKTPEKKSAFIKKLIANYNASKIYVETTGCPTSSSGEKIEALQALSLNNNVMANNFVFKDGVDKFEDKCRQIAGPGCEDAKKVLATWDADFKWTMSQHRIGAEFAAKNCQKLSKDSSALREPAICKNADKELSQPYYNYGQKQNQYDVKPVIYDDSELKNMSPSKSQTNK